MRKLLTLVLSLLLLASFSQAALADANIEIFVNGEQLLSDVDPIIEDGSTLVPVRVITEKLGAVVEWDATDRRVDIYWQQSHISLLINDPLAYVDLVAYELAVPARIVDDRTMVPLRFIGETMGATVSWDAVSRSVFVDLDAATTPAPPTEPLPTDLPDNPDLAQIKEQLLAIFNEQRAKSNLAPLIEVEQLSNLAQSQAAAASIAGDISNLDDADLLSEQTTLYGVYSSHQIISKGYPDAGAIADAMQDTVLGGAFLSADATFIGLGFYKPTAEGNADIIAVAEIVNGGGFFIGEDRLSTDQANLQLNGYANGQTLLSVYLLADDQTYLTRKSYPLSVAADGAFSLEISFEQSGNYALVLGEDIVYVDYHI